MDWREFIASLVDSLAWPASAAIIVALLRRQIGALLEGQLKRLKAGPVELEWEQAAVEVAESVATAAPASDEEDEEVARLMALAADAPNAAILESFLLIERELHALANAGGVTLPRTAPAATIANQMADIGLISEQSATAVRGLATIRNLAAHGEARETPGRAREFVVMTQAVLFALRSQPGE